MIKNRKGDYALRICDECGHEQWAGYWNLVKKPTHLCRYCSNKRNGIAKRGKVAHNKGKQYQAKRVGNWYINGGGYVCLWIGKHTLPNKVGGYYLEHRLQAELKAGRPLSDDERVHHIDSDKTNNTEANLFVCQDDFDHQKVHSQLEQVSMELVKLGVIKFDHTSGRYSIDPYVRESISKSPELLGNPERDNQQRSLRELSEEERSTTIQKWSTLKRAEAGDISSVSIRDDDIVCSAQ